MNTGLHLPSYGAVSGTISYGGAYFYNGAYVYGAANVLTSVSPHGVPDALIFSGAYLYGSGHIFGEAAGIYSLYNVPNASIYSLQAV